VNTNTILDDIVAHKRTEISSQKKAVSQSALVDLAEQTEPPRGFVKALKTKVEAQGVAIIAEIKKASPSKGIIKEKFKPDEIAYAYKKAGACCLSVLTDQKYFLGHNNDLKLAKASSDLPVLRKDFILDEYQLFEARAVGADCVLLIAAILEQNRLADLNSLATDLGLDVLIEIHNKNEMDRALTLKPPLLGINNRNLKTFETTLNTTLDLVRYIPDDTTVVTESGISMAKDIETMLANNIHAFLIGEMFMRAANPGETLRDLLDEAALFQKNDSRGS